MNMQKDLDIIKDVISGNHTYGLECEILCEAFYAIQNNPDLTIGEAIEIGFQEWVK